MASSTSTKQKYIAQEYIILKENKDNINSDNIEVVINIFAYKQLNKCLLEIFMFTITFVIYIVCIVNLKNKSNNLHGLVYKTPNCDTVTNYLTLSDHCADVTFNGHTYSKDNVEVTRIFNEYEVKGQEETRDHAADVSYKYMNVGLLSGTQYTFNIRHIDIIKKCIDDKYISVSTVTIPTIRPFVALNHNVYTNTDRFQEYEDLIYFIQQNVNNQDNWCTKEGLYTLFDDWYKKKGVSHIDGLKDLKVGWDTSDYWAVIFSILPILSIRFTLWIMLVRKLIKDVDKDIRIKGYIIKQIDNTKPDVKIHKKIQDKDPRNCEPEVRYISEDFIHNYGFYFNNNIKIQNFKSKILFKKENDKIRFKRLGFQLMLMFCRLIGSMYVYFIEYAWKYNCTINDGFVHCGLNKSLSNSLFCLNRFSYGFYLV